MEFFQKFAMFLFMTVAMVMAARTIGAKLGGERRLDAVLGAVVVFFAGVVITGASLGFSGMISVRSFLIASLVPAFAALILRNKTRTSLFDEEFPWKPLTAGFFLPSR